MPISGQIVLGGPPTIITSPRGKSKITPDRVATEEQAKSIPKGPCAFCGFDDFAAILTGAGDSDDRAILSIRAAACGSLSGPFWIPPKKKEKNRASRPGEWAWVHRNCALYSPEVVCTSNLSSSTDNSASALPREDDVWHNVATAVRRSRRLRCAHCRLRGASIGCTSMDCRRSFHLACAIDSGWHPASSSMDEETDDSATNTGCTAGVSFFFCPDHRYSAHIHRRSNIPPAVIVDETAAAGGGDVAGGIAGGKTCSSPPPPPAAPSRCISPVMPRLSEQLLARDPSSSSAAVVDRVANDRDLSFKTLTSDGTESTAALLGELEELLSQQLPRLPRQYISNLLFSNDHRSTLLLEKAVPASAEENSGGEETAKVLGGICYRQHQTHGFAELAFCATATSEQGHGLGSQLVERVKYEALRDGAAFFLVYADHTALGFFAKQGFRRRLALSNGFHFFSIRHYDGSTLMECPLIHGAQLERWLERQREMLRRAVPVTPPASASPLLVRGGATPGAGRRKATKGHRVASAVACCEVKKKRAAVQTALPMDENCRACRGRHVAHTCGLRGRLVTQNRLKVAGPGAKTAAAAPPPAQVPTSTIAAASSVAAVPSSSSRHQSRAFPGCEQCRNPWRRQSHCCKRAATSAKKTAAAMALSAAGLSRGTKRKRTPAVVVSRVLPATGDADGPPPTVRRSKLAKPCEQLDAVTLLPIQVWRSGAAAAKGTGVPQVRVSAACRRGAGEAGGFRWRFC